jgi:hypothetical protein
LKEKRILEWTKEETKQWFKEWLQESYFETLQRPNGDTLARMSLARITKGVQDENISEDIYKAVGGVIETHDEGGKFTLRQYQRIKQDRGNNECFKYMPLSFVLYFPRYSSWLKNPGYCRHYGCSSRKK